VLLLLIATSTLEAQIDCVQLDKLTSSNRIQRLTFGRTVQVGFHEIKTDSSCMIVTAEIQSEQLNQLEKTMKGEVVTFRRNGEMVADYPDEVELLVTLSPCFDTTSSFRYGQMPNNVDRLNFKIGWSGSSKKEPQAVVAQAAREQWTELTPPARWYRIILPTKNIPLTETIEVHFDSDGEPDACVNGRL